MKIIGKLVIDKYGQYFRHERHAVDERTKRETKFKKKKKEKKLN